MTRLRTSSDRLGNGIADSTWRPVVRWIRDHTYDDPTLSWVVSARIAVVVFILGMINAFVIGGDLSATRVWLFAGLVTSIVAALMSIRITIERGWGSREFWFTAGQWAAAGLYFYLAWRNSELAQPPAWFNQLVRALTATAGAMVLVSLDWSGLVAWLLRTPPLQEVDVANRLRRLVTGRRRSNQRDGSTTA